MRAGPTEQERYIHDLSYVLSAGQALFYPSLYDGGKEPADIAWVANRCAVLMYVTSGKASYEKKRRHNLRQLHRWVRKWREGAALQGTRDGTAYNFDYNDIDHIIGISVIDGENIGCRYEQELVADALGRGLKISVCFTITNRVFAKLVHRSVGIRDILPLANYLFDLKVENVSEAAAMDFVESSIRDCAAEARRKFDGLWDSPEELNRSWDETRYLLHSTKLSNAVGSYPDMISDLTAEDAIWLSVAERSMVMSIAQVGDRIAVAEMARQNYKIKCLVAPSVRSICNQIGEYVPKGPGVFLMSTLELGTRDPLRTLAITELQGAPIVHSEVALLRDQLVR